MASFLVSCFLLFHSNWIRPTHSQSIYRLPTTIVPVSYDVGIFPHLDIAQNNEYDFEGWEFINVNISRDHLSNKYANDSFDMQLNKGSDLQIRNVSISINTVQYDSIESSYSEDTEIVSMSFSITNNAISTLMASDDYLIATLYIEYISFYSTPSSRGAYLSQYSDYNNVTVVNLVTQFQPIFARTTFPCFDEPSFKATFKFTFIAPIRAIVLYNTPIANVTETDEYTCEYQYANGTTSSECKIVTFDPSPVMSTYLNAFVIGDYQVIESINEYMPIENFPQKAYWPWNSPQSDVEYAYNASKYILNYIGSSDFFDYTYTLPKLDDVAILARPSAMEHWGLVTYDTRRYLLNPDTADLASKIACISVIGHELVHQWFGNLITCDTWKNTWINEGFARFLQFVIGNATYPELNVFDDFAMREHNMLNRDVSLYTQSIIVDHEIETPQQNVDIFNTIAYDKAGAILQMIDNVMGRDQFISAVKQLLNEYQYKNVNSDQLIAVFDEFNNDFFVDFIPFFNSWLKQPGFPIVSVDVVKRKGKDLKIKWVQERMFRKTIDFDGQSSQRWHIPIKLRTAESTARNFTHEFGSFIAREVEITFPKYKSDGVEYYLFNSELIFYYRIKYGKYLMSLITKNFDHLSFWEQFNVISDFSALMMETYETGSSYLSFLDKISDKLSLPNQEREELSYQVWDLVISSLYAIDERLCEFIEFDSEYQHNFHTFCRGLLGPIYDALDGWNQEDTDSEHVIRLRTTVITALVRFNDTTVIDYGYNLMAELIDANGGSIPLDGDGQIDNTENNLVTPDLVQPMLDSSMALLDRAMFNNIIAIWDESSDDLKQQILHSFDVLYRDFNLSQTAYEFIIENVDDNMKVTGMNYLKSCYAINAVWEELIGKNASDSDSDWLYLYNIGSNIETLLRLTETFASEERMEEIGEFYAQQIENGVIEDIKTVNETLENIGSRTLWVQENADDMNEYLVDYYSNKKKSSDDLETWEIALIIVASVVGCFIIVVLMILCRKKGKRGEQAAYQGMDSTADGYGAA